MAYFKNSVAMRYGVGAAILLQHLWEKTQQKEKTGCRLAQGRYWHPCPQRMLLLHFPYFTKNMVQKTLKMMMDERVIQKKELSGCPFDHTAWYAFTEYGEKLMGGWGTEK